MSEENFQIHVSGKAVYKAVKNLLENDIEFRQKIMDQVAKELSNTEKVEEMISHHVRDLVTDNPDFKKALEDEARHIVRTMVPIVMREKIDGVVRSSMLEMAKKLMNIK